MFHEQEAAQSGKFAQTSNLLFPGPGKAKWSRLSICFFPGWEKAKWSRLPTKTFSFWCVFGWAQPSMNKRRLSQASLLRLPICNFPAREKAKWSRLSICFFPGWEKAKWSSSNRAMLILVCFWLGPTLHEQEAAQSGQFAQTSNLLFPGPGKSKMV